MGMRGMTNEAAATYAAAGDKKASKMTVAEFRNKINPTTHYYDTWTAEDLLSSLELSSLEKINVLIGPWMSKCHGNAGGWISEVLEKIKKEMN